MNKKNITHRLEQCYSGVIYDAMREQGLRNCVLPSSIKPLHIERRLAGPAYTVLGKRCEASDHETLLAWTKLLSTVPQDSVLVIQPNDDEQAYMGELSAETLNFRGVRGAVIDGNIRDSEFINRLGFRIFSKGTSPMDVVGSWLPTELGKSVTIGKVTVNTDDFIVADRDGVVVIPQNIVENITARAESFLSTESNVRNEILQGISPETAYLNHSKF